MRSPQLVLNSLSNHASTKSYKYKRLYRILYNPEFFAIAYQNIYANEGNMTNDANNNTIDGMSLIRIDKLISTLKDHSYKPNPSRRVYIPKSNGKLRPISIPSVDDKLIQEVIRMILESIYEPTFSNWSHSFRPKRSCHTALRQVKNHFNGITWFIEGDIEGFFDNINHHNLISILRERIEDEHFIALIWKFLKAGYLEDNIYHKTYSGTPQGSIISPILSNIYLDKLDKFMEEYKESYNKGIKRKFNKEYMSIKDKSRWLKKQKYSQSEWNSLTDEQRKEVISKVKELDRLSFSMNSVDLFDPDFRRFSYVRYADDFICGIIGTKEDAFRIKEDIRCFLNEKLNLHLSIPKTLITHRSKAVSFLGYEIRVSNSNSTKRNSSGNKMRYFKGNIKLYIPPHKWKNKLIKLKALKINYVDGKEVFEPCHRNFMISNDDLEILNQYNSEIRGFKNYYSLADNISVLNNFYYVMRFSMYKAYAAKYKSNIGNIRNKFGHKKFAVDYVNNKGKAYKAYFYDEGFTKTDKDIKNGNIDNLPNNLRNLNRTSLMDRLREGKCMNCGISNDIEMHHVRKLKNLKGKAKWEKHMIARRRKTLPLYMACHDKLHAGELN